jgi:hypothetical protein
MLGIKKRYRGYALQKSAAAFTNLVQNSSHSSDVADAPTLEAVSFEGTMGYFEQ